MKNKSNALIIIMIVTLFALVACGTNTVNSNSSQKLFQKRQEVRSRN